MTKPDPVPVDVSSPKKPGYLGLGRDVDDALVGRVVNPNVVPLVGIEVLEHILGRSGGPGSGVGGGRRPGSPGRPARAAGGGLRANAARNLGQGGPTSDRERSPKKTTTSTNVSNAVTKCDSERSCQ